MAITSSRTVQIQFSGDITADVIQSDLDNTTSPAVSIFVVLAIGNNAITPPVVSGISVTGLTVIPPAGNTTVITVKGVNGDTGFPIHITNPFSIGIDPTFTGLVLSVATQINGVRVIWT